jgi:hypothetical protein
MAISRPGQDAGLADVVPFPQQGASASAYGVTFDYPGWQIWYSRRDGLWRARRAGDFFMDSTSQRTKLVTAADVGHLLADVERQAVLDLREEFPDWAADLVLTRYSCAIWRSSADGDARPVISARNIAALVDLIRSGHASGAADR